MRFIEDHSESDDMFPASRGLGEMQPFPERSNATPLVVGTLPRESQRDITLGAMTVLNSILANPYAGGFEISVTSEGNTMQISGRLTERTYQIPCPYCREIFEVPQVLGRYCLRCSRPLSGSQLGRWFQVVIKSTRHGHKIIVV